MRVQDIASIISGELSAKYSRQDETGEHFTPETPDTIARQLSEVAALFHQLAPIAEQISIAKSKEGREPLEGEADIRSSSRIGDSPRFKRSFIRGLPPQDERSGKKIVNGLPISGYRNGDQA